MMDHVVDDAVPPVTQHHADGEPVSHAESQAQPQRHEQGEAQNRNAHPRRRADEGEGSAVVHGVHGRKEAHAMQGYAMQHILHESPKHQSGQAGAQPFRGGGPGDVVDGERSQSNDHHRIDDEVGVVAQLAELHRVAPRIRFHALFDHEFCRMLAEV